MKFRGILSKTLAAAVAAAQVISMCGFAAVTGGGSGTDSGFYWYEQFDTNTTTMKAGTDVTKDGVSRDGGYAAKITNGNTTATKQGYITTGIPLDFSKGPVVVAYEEMPVKGVSFLSLNDVSGSFLAYLTRFEGGTIKGYNQTDKSTPVTAWATNCGFAASTKTYSTNSAYYKMQSVLDYDTETNQLSVKYFVDGEPLVKSGGEVLGYTITLPSGCDIDENVTLRFNLGAGAAAVIDNVAIYTEGSPEFGTGGWISTDKGTVGLSINNAMTYKDSDDAEVTLPSYAKFANNLTTADYELKKYNIGSDPMLLGGGETATSTVAWKGDTGVTLSGLSITDTANECYVLKLINPNSITSLYGKPITGTYALLHSGASVSYVREAFMYDENGNALTLSADGKLPTEVKKIEFALASNSTLAAKDITFTGSNVSVISVQDTETGRYVLNLSKVTLENAEEYTITAGDKSGVYTTTGEKPASHYATAAFQGFDDEASAAGFVTTAEEISTTWQNGSVLCTNSVASTGTAVKVSYPVTGTGFDFSKGALYLSFDATLNQDIGSILFGPELIVSSGTILAYMPGLEYTGLRGRNSSGGRVKTNSGKATMANGGTVNLGILLRYYPEDGSIGYIQFADGKRLEDEQGNPLAEILKTGLSDKLSEGLQLRINGRNFPDGVYIDNIRLTTVDGITAEQILTMSGTTATIDIESTVEFDPSAPAEAVAPVYDCSLTKSDIKVTRYAAEDKLFVNGTAVTDFGFDPETMTVSNLAAQNTGDVFVIEILDTSKLASLAEKELDVKCFKTGEANGGLIKTRILNANGDEIYVDADGKWPTNAAKVCFTFAKGYAEDGVKLGETAAVYTDGEYVVDLSAAPFAASTEYTVSVNNAEFAKLTTAAGAFSVLKPTINDADGKASVGVSNTTDKEEVVYLINACYNSDGELISLVYDRITVAVGENSVKTGASAPDLSGAAVQKAFVWDGFEKLIPYADCTERTLNAAD